MSAVTVISAIRMSAIPMILRLIDRPIIVRSSLRGRGFIARLGFGGSLLTAISYRWYIVKKREAAGRRLPDAAGTLFGPPSASKWGR
jgi:hypothetical protein